MSSSVEGAGESSVVFNLRQLLQLEAERQARELHEAEQARLAEVERERAATLAREQQAREQERAARAQAVQAETERQLALLRVRLAAEAAERAQQVIASRQTLALSRRASWQRYAWSACLLLTAAGSVLILSQVGREAADARAHARQASALAASWQRELAQLRAQLTAAVSAERPAAAPVPSVLAAVPHESAPAKHNRERRARVLPRHAKQNPTSTTVVPALDIGSDDDPIGGL